MHVRKGNKISCHYSVCKYKSYFFLLFETIELKLQIMMLYFWYGRFEDSHENYCDCCDVETGNTCQLDRNVLEHRYTKLRTMYVNKMDCFDFLPVHTRSRLNLASRKSILNILRAHSTKNRTRSPFVSCVKYSLKTFKAHTNIFLATSDKVCRLTMPLPRNMDPDWLR